MTEASKHTPGPWTAQISKGRKALCVQSPTTWVCGELQNENNTIDESEAVANAHLIAAAPELLVALKDALLLLEHEFPNPAPNGQIVRARAAIAKAEGGAA